MKGLLLSLVVALAALEEHGAESTMLPPIETLFSVERPAANDVVRLEHGAELRGKITSATIELHTALGALSIPCDLVAGIRFDATPEHLHLVVLANRNRLTGFIHQPIAMQSAAGETNLSPGAPGEIIFAIRPGETNQVQPTQFALLDSGEILSGRLTLPPVNAESPSGPREIPVEKIAVMRSERNGFRVQLQDGSEYRANLGGAVRIALEFGPVLEIPAARVKAIYHETEFLPVELRQAFGTAPTVAGSTEPPADFAAPPGMVWIPPGKFIMGSSIGEIGRGADEDPQTEVQITRGFWMAEREVTQGEYLALIGSNPSNFVGDTNRPVEKVNWHEAREYCARLTEMARAENKLPPGYVYRLPTEAEWEYACRAGTTTRFSYGDDPTDASLHEYAWFIGNSDSTSQPVGRLKPNPWGLYDMHGNVWEWCLDLWGASYPGGSVRDYTGASEGWLRVARGGSWLYPPEFSRSANRDDYGPDNRCSDIGFRVVLGPEL